MKEKRLTNWNVKLKAIAKFRKIISKQFAIDIYVLILINSIKNISQKVYDHVNNKYFNP